MAQLAVIGPLPRDLIGHQPAQIGGGPWHAARALRILGRTAVICAKCGVTEHSEYEQRLAGLGLPTFVARGAKTTTFSLSYGLDGARTMSVETIGDPWLNFDVPEALLRSVRWLHVAPLLRGDFDPVTLAHLARGRRVLFDAQGLVRAREIGPLRLNADFDRDLLRHVTVLKLAEEEAEVIGDLKSLGVPELLITAGPRGSRVISREGELHVPARALSGDPTGAGDAFAATYALLRGDGHSPFSAATRATALVATLLANQGRPVG